MRWTDLWKTVSGRSRRRRARRTPPADCNCRKPAWRSSTRSRASPVRPTSSLAPAEIGRSPGSRTDTAEFMARCGVDGWTLHDLRRTARSLMSRAGVPSEHAERVLGHVIKGVEGIYDRHGYSEEKGSRSKSWRA